jgi:putative glutamine amidotransferase
MPQRDSPHTRCSATGPILKPMRPLIGIPQCLDDRGRWRPGRSYLYLDRAYARAVETAGGVALHLPLQGEALQGIASPSETELIRRLVSGLDGLLLPGGGDFLPESPPPPQLRFDPTPPEQLAFDRALLAAALGRGIPILGVCYGEQLLALHFGGSIHHHLPLDLPEASRHDLSEGNGRHGVLIEAGTRLAEAVGGGEISVNSRHHQAVADPGRGMRVCARSADGVIEGIEREGEGEGFCVGVQWHPEGLEEPHARALFLAFVEAARRGAAGRDSEPATG